jgi:MFS family permease
LPLIAAAGIEAAVAVLSDVWSRSRLVVAGQATLAVSLAFVAWTRSPWGLTIGLGLAGAASGVACGAAQAMLLAARPTEHHRTLLRWSLGCAVGDVLTPLVTAAAIALGTSYRGAAAAIALLVAGQCLLSALALRGEAPGAATAEDDEPPEPLRAVLARALRLPRLWIWLFASASCTFLDELVIVLSVLRLEHLGIATPAVATSTAVALSVGSALGAAATDRVVTRTTPRTVLVLSAIACAAAVVALLVSSTVPGAVAAMLLVGIASAPHHPLSQAQAYAELPDRPGTVQALGQIFVVLDVGIPLVLGVVADRAGLDVAMALLLVQPAVVGLVAAALHARRE